MCVRCNTISSGTRGITCPSQTFTSSKQSLVDQLNTLTNRATNRNYELAIEFMWENSFLQSIVYEGLGLHDLMEMKPIYHEYCMHILRNECSVMMLDETETKILAVALLEWMTDAWHSWYINREERERERDRDLYIYIQQAN